MSVRTSLFLLITALILSLLGAQLWLSQQQSRQLADALQTTAFGVARDTLGEFLRTSDSENEFVWRQADRTIDLSLVADARGASLLLENDGRQQYVAIPRDSIDATLRASRQQQWLSSAVVFLLALLAAGWLAHRYARPLRQLTRAAERVAGGELGAQIDSGAHTSRELRQALQAFNRMSAQLAELDARNRQLQARQELSNIADLARGLAHTLRNPLHTLGLTLDEMARSDLPANRRETLAPLARRQIAHIDHWLRALLAVTQGEYETARTLSLPALAERIASEFADQGVRIDIAAAADLSPLQGHENEVASLLHTLIGNAVEACQTMHQGSADGQHIEGQHIDVVHVDVLLQNINDGVRIQVRDNGSGLNPELRERLFQPHVTDKTQGAGMGLFLARRIARARYHGDLHLDDNTPRGVIATLELHHVR